MRITIIGCSAGIGLEALKQALEKGHQVTALSTKMGNLPNHPKLKKITGSAILIDEAQESIKNTDAVLITVGTKKKKGVTLFSEIARTIIKAQEETQFAVPVLVVSGFGTGESKKYLSFFMRSVITLFLKDQYKDKAIMEDLFSKSNVNWEIIKPGMLTDTDLTANYKVYSKLVKGMKVGKISRADVAHYMVQEAENPKHLQQSIVLA